jgi:hypothetical protein
LCQSFARAFACLRQLLESVQADPSNFEGHQARHAALRDTLEPWWQVHELRVGMAFAPTAADPAILNAWLDDLLQQGRVSDEHRASGEGYLLRGRESGASCWELAFPEVFYQPDGKRRDDAGFSCVLGNPPWDKIKPERDGFYLAYDPLIRQFQGTQKNRRIEDLHRESPAIAAAWQQYEFQAKRQADVLLGGGMYFHQTAVVEEEVEGDDGEPVIKKKTTGGDPDCFKFFLERAWQLAASGRTVGMVMSSSLHNAQGCTGLRRLVLDQCRMRALCNFDNERKIFPGIDNRQDFDIIVFDKGGATEAFDAAFMTRETERALQSFRTHRSHLVIATSNVRQLSPQTLTLFEFRSQMDVDLVEKAYRLHPPFGEGLMPRLGLKFRREFDMGNSNYLFRTRDWLRKHGCVQEPGEQWRAADAEWYRSRGYIERPIAQWYVLFENNRATAHKLRWPVKSKKGIRESDLNDFDIRITLPGGSRFFAKGPDDDGHPAVFVPPDEARDTDVPAYIPAAKKLKSFTLAPAIRPGDVFVPLMEGEWVYHLDHRAYAYVSGAGSWVVTRPSGDEQSDVVPHFFAARLDAETRTPTCSRQKLGFRDVTSASNERSFVGAVIPSDYPCGHQLPVFAPSTELADELARVACWASSAVTDSFMRLVTGGHATLGVMSILQAPCPLPDSLFTIINRKVTKRAGADTARAWTDAVLAEVFELTPHQYAYILSTFPLLDRDQPPLPHDYRIRPTNKGLERKPISFITRDLALLTYFDYLAGRLEIKRDPERVARICPEGVPDPPTDIVEFFAQAGVDIGGKTEYAVASNGPFRDLRERVAKARELGAVAYVPTIDRRRATFVERAAAASGLSPEEGVLTPEMAQHVLHAKAEREAKWERAMHLWEATPKETTTEKAATPKS